MAKLAALDEVHVIFLIAMRAGFRARLVVPLVGADRVVGALVIRRKQSGKFPKNVVELLQTFAAQSVLAIQNAWLFREIEDKSRQLQMASENSDGTVSLQEFQAAYEGIFKAMDANKDGRLTLEEIQDFTHGAGRSVPRQ